jgi:hypothetical protein
MRTLIVNHESVSSADREIFYPAFPELPRAFPGISISKFFGGNGNHGGIARLSEYGESPDYTDRIHGEDDIHSS